MTSRNRAIYQFSAIVGQEKMKLALIPVSDGRANVNLCDGNPVEEAKKRCERKKLTTSSGDPKR